LYKHSIGHTVVWSNRPLQAATNLY